MVVYCYLAGLIISILSATEAYRYINSGRALSFSVAIAGTSVAIGLFIMAGAEHVVRGLKK